MPHLLVAGNLHPAGEALLEDLKLKGFTVDYVREVSEASYAPLIARADALVIRTQPLTAATIGTAERLKVVSRHGVGYDAVDVAALNARRIALTIVGDVNSVSVAEHAMMMLLAASKHVLRADRAMREPARWNWRNRLEQREVHGKNLLIIGYGRAGRQLAKLAAAFTMQVKAYDPYLPEAGWPLDGVAPVTDLGEGLAWADCLSLHVPKREQPLIGEAELRRVKPGIVIVNTARGGIIDETALAHALGDGRVAAAGIDVLEIEPPDGASPLAALDNVLLSPHIAGLTEEAAMRMAIDCIENAVRYLDGSIDPARIVNRAALAQ